MTDGEVGDHSVQRCDKIIEEAKQKSKFEIQKSIVYVVGDYHEPNLSVTCPFTRSSESKVFTKSGASPLKELISYTAEDFIEVSESNIDQLLDDKDLDDDYCNDENLKFSIE